MKKSLILFFVGVFLVTFCSSFANAGDVTATIWAGNSENAGWVWIKTEGSGVRVRFYPENDWELAEAHIHIAQLKCQIPQTGDPCGSGNPGNPKIGHFMRGVEFDPPLGPVLAYDVTIPFSEIGVSGGDVFVAIHVVMVQREDDGFGGLVVVRDETGWAGPCNQTFPGWTPGDTVPFPFEDAWKSRWGWCFLFLI